MEFSKKLINEALYQLLPSYRKMLKVNLTDDTYELILATDSEDGILEQKQFKNFSEYLAWFSNSEAIHKEDKKAFKEFIDNLDVDRHLVYRRKNGDSYIYVVMRFKPTVNYAPEFREYIVYVKDIDSVYSEEYNKTVVKIGTVDSFTGLYNRLAYERDIEYYKGSYIGVVYCDLNGLKHINDSQGHKAGDKMILQFANLLSINFKDYKCYHISGDEFIVLALNTSIRQFLKEALIFHKSMWALEIPIASMGYSVGEFKEYADIYNDAERAMYDDKKIFHEKYPEYKRK